MRVTAFIILLFFISLNLSLYLINETQVVPYSQSPYETPENMMGRLVHLDLSFENLAIGGTTLTVLVILGYITGHLILGGTVAIILFAMDLVFPIIKWILFGFPTFLGQMGVHLVVYTAISALMALVFFWFLLGFIAQRPLDEA